MGVAAKMDAVFIYPNPSGGSLNDVAIELPLGLTYLATNLKLHGYPCAIVGANAPGLRLQKTVDEMPSDVELVGMYAYSVNYSSINHLAPPLSEIYDLKHESEEAAMRVRGTNAVPEDSGSRVLVRGTE
jgi:hypothetical protein